MMNVQTAPTIAPIMAALLLLSQSSTYIHSEQYDIVTVHNIRNDNQNRKLLCCKDENLL